MTLTYTLQIKLKYSTWKKPIIITIDGMDEEEKKIDFKF